MSFRETLVTGDWREELDRAIDDRFAKMVAVRRRLHANPELSGEERQTSLFLYQLLGDQGFDVRMGPEGRGVVADAVTLWDGSSRGLIALRADLDGLRIHDAKEVEYRSQRDGVMHACGHDAHTAIVFGAISSLAALGREGLLPRPIRVRGIFQPAEETCQGAKEMIEVGSLEGVDAIIAAHVDPSRTVGRIGLRAGVLTANCDEVQITITGRGGHAARPHEASDPIAAAAQMINSLYLNVPRLTDSQDAVVVTVGQILGGDHANVIPERVVLRGTVRTLDSGVRQRTFEHIRRLARGVSEMSETKISVEQGSSSRSVYNDAGIIQLLRRSGREVLGEDGIEEIPRPVMGSEDFAFYLDKAPGAMFRLGCRSAHGGGGPLHSPTFDVDEEAIRIGAKIMARAVVFWSDPNRNTAATETRAAAAD